jgi:hypothetical protein
MPRKGVSNNPSGRKKGIPNKAHRPLKDNISEFLSRNWAKIEKDFESLDPYSRIQAYTKLMDYVLPRLKSIDANVSIEQKLEKMSDEQLNALIDQILNEPDHEKQH